MKRKKPTRMRFPVSRVIDALRLKELRLFGEIALEDAAFCVFLCGALNSLLEPIIKLLSEGLLNAQKSEISVLFVPKFTESAIKIELTGILESNSGKLIKGLISALIEKRRKRNEASPPLSGRTIDQPG